MGEVLQPQGTSMRARPAKAGREQVLAAADGILREGHRPTIAAIQERLGGGSPNSIVAHLKEWYSELRDRLAYVEAPAEGLHLDVHRAALALQRAIRSNHASNVDAESTEALIRSLRAEIASQKFLLDELRTQRGRDQQALAEARALLMRKDEQIQEMHDGHGMALTRIAVLEQRLRFRRLAARSIRKRTIPKTKRSEPRSKTRDLKKHGLLRSAKRPKKLIQKSSGRR